MARTEGHVDAPRETVFAVLSDPKNYSQWVVGSREIRNADPDWPQPGARFGHTVGVPPFTRRDYTEVLESRAPERLRLLVRARPLPDAVVELQLAPEDGGTRVTMVEDPLHPWLNALIGPLGHAVIRLRNRESLRRLKLLAETPARRR